MMYYEIKVLYWNCIINIKGKSRSLWATFLLGASSSHFPSFYGFSERYAYSYYTIIKQQEAVCNLN